MPHDALLDHKNYAYDLHCDSSKTAALQGARSRIEYTLNTTPEYLDYNIYPALGSEVYTNGFSASASHAYACQTLCIRIELRSRGARSCTVNGYVRT